jgi:prevent-host-death family protein
MYRGLSATTLRSKLGRIVERVRRGERFTVFYRNRPAFQIIPVVASGPDPGPLEDDSLYQAEAVGRSTVESTSADHDSVLYGD